jgi:hypothetical protein
MLQRTKDARLRLKLEKCSFGKAEVEILGHQVSFGEVRPNDKHRECLQHSAEPTNATEWPNDKHRECLQHSAEPTNATELLTFLGLLQFFSTHIDHLADLSAPLYEVLKGTPWN